MAQSVFSKFAIADLYGQPGTVANPPANFARLYYNAGSNQLICVDSNGNNLITGGGGGVSTFTGDGTVLSNSGSTGAVTATLATHAANTVLAGPASGSAATPTFRSLTQDDIPIPTSSLWLPTSVTGSIGVNTFTGGVANQVIVQRVTLTYKITITNATVRVSTGQAAQTARFAVYSNDGNTKLLDTGTYDTTSIATLTNSFTGVTLNPGTYLLASSCTGATAQCSAVTGVAIYFGGTNSVFFTAANPMAAGAMPATLGALTNLTSGNFPVCMFFA